jgi:hypothetical protein
VTAHASHEPEQKKETVKTGFSLNTLTAPYSKLQTGGNEGIFGGAVMEKIYPKTKGR